MKKNILKENSLKDISISTKKLKKNVISYECETEDNLVDEDVDYINDPIEFENHSRNLIKDYENEMELLKQKKLLIII